MKKYLIYAGIISCFFGSVANVSAESNFKVYSKDLSEGYFTDKFVHSGFGCSGQNISPQISWENIPKGTKSFLVTIFDPDAPTGSGWWHWVVANIPKNVVDLPQGAGTYPNLLPLGATAVNNDFSHNQYGGPCPPIGTQHRYQITVFALNVPQLDFPENATPALVGFMANSNILDKATTTYLYKNER